MVLAFFSLSVFAIQIPHIDSARRLVRFKKEEMPRIKVTRHISMHLTSTNYFTKFPHEALLGQVQRFLQLSRYVRCLHI